MARFERVLIDPEPDDLDSALRLAVEAANARRSSRLLDWPLADRNSAPAEGFRQWNGSDGTTRGGEGRSVVVLAWWTDRAGRKHHRVVGRRGTFNRPMLDNLLCPFGEPRPPLWLVYPDHVFLKRHGDERQAVAVCACGAFGPPEQLGWMGTCCDACHDLREEGRMAAPAWLDPRRATLVGEEGRTQMLAYSPDGRTLAVGTGRDLVTLWDTATGEPRGRLTARQDDWILGVGWLDGGVRLATADTAGVLRFWSGLTGLPIGDELTLGACDCFAASADGLMGRGSRSGVVLFGRDDTLRCQLEGGLSGVSTLAFSPDGSLVAGGSRMGAVGVWESKTGQLLERIDTAGALVTALAFSPSGQTLAIALHPAPGGKAPETSRVLLWDVTRGEERHSFPGHTGGSRCVAFAPDGRVVASGGEDGLVRLWDAHSGQERLALEWHLDAVSSVAFAPDGMSLATGGFDGTVKLWPREVLRPASRARAPLARR